MSALGESLATGAAIGVSLSVTVWALQSARDLVEGFLAARWPQHFGDQCDTCKHAKHPDQCGVLLGDDDAFCECPRRFP